MSCSKHPNYKGLRKGRNVSDCQECENFYKENRKNQVFEKRNHKKVETVISIAQEAQSNEVITKQEEIVPVDVQAPISAVQHEVHEVEVDQTALTELEIESVDDLNLDF